MELICVAPERATEVWPHVAHWIKAAMERADIGSFNVVERAVLNGSNLLWLVTTDAPSIRAAVVTDIHETESRKVCVIVACGGVQMNDWLSLIEGIHDYARAEGCSASRILGPQAWGKVLDGYKATAVILERSL